MNKLLAKPSGILYSEHIQNVKSQAEDLLSLFPMYVKKYRTIVNENLRDALMKAVEYHDLGKKHQKWQNACQLDYLNYLKNGKVDGKHLRRVGLRHEIASLVYLKEKNIDVVAIVKIAIAAHHSKLSYNHEHRWKENSSFQIFWDEFLHLKHAFRISEENSFHKALLNRYKFSGPRALLQFSDHLASKKEDNEEIPILTTFSYEFPYKEKRNVQKIVSDNIDDQFLLIRAPTGSGKTDASLLWAQHQISSKRADRLVIAMPTRFTSNALSINVAKNISKVGIYHSTISFDSESNKLGQEYARLLFTPITVTTIDHLLIALTGTKEEHHTIFFNLAHSCVIIDEADFYDSFTQANILVLLEVLKILKVPVMLMSATLPESSKQQYYNSGFDNVHITEDKSNLSEIKCKITLTGKVTHPKEISDILLNNSFNTKIIFANTIERAFQYYDYFISNNIFPIVYHSRFTEPDKKNIEKKLINNLGEEASKKGRADGIAILTQIGEMSVNISAEVMVSDICPIDRLVQRIGRLNRFSKNLGEVYLIEPVKNDEFYPAPYGVFDRKTKQWIPFNSLLASKKALLPGQYSYGDLVDLVNKVYSEVQEYDSKTKLNQKELIQMILNNWLILPAQQIGEDDFNTIFWKSRNILPNEKIFVNDVPKYFKNYYDYRAFEFANSVEIPTYLLKNGIKKGLFFERHVSIRNDEEIERIWISRFGQYDPNVGLRLADDLAIL
jgi:CRISPR-associated endonuclease/helicase Cas3